MKFSFSGGLFWIASQKSTLWRSPLFTTITASPSLLPGSDSTEMAESPGRSSRAPARSQRSRSPASTCFGPKIFRPSRSAKACASMACW